MQFLFIACLLLTGCATKYNAPSIATSFQKYGFSDKRKAESQCQLVLINSQNEPMRFYAEKDYLTMVPARGFVEIFLDHGTKTKYAFVQDFSFKPDYYGVNTDCKSPGSYFLEFSRKCVNCGEYGLPIKNGEFVSRQMDGVKFYDIQRKRAEYVMSSQPKAVFE